MVLELKEVLNIIKSGEWLQSLQFITADLAKKKGGQIIDFGKCRIARRRGLQQSANTDTNAGNFSKSANHNANFTLNIELENKEIRKVHPILITKINNIAVI